MLNKEILGLTTAGCDAESGSDTDFRFIRRKTSRTNDFKLTVSTCIRYLIRKFCCIRKAKSQKDFQNVRAENPSHMSEILLAVALCVKPMLKRSLRPIAHNAKW